MYTPLYIKTDNSLLQSLITIDGLIEYALKNNLKSLSITDSNMYGVIEFYNKCISNNIKPIIGLELNIDSKQIILYCMHMKGYKNLLKLSTLQTEKQLEFSDLEKFNEDLICIVPFNSLDIFEDLYKIYSVIYKGYKNKYEYENIDKKTSIYLNLTCYLNESDSIYIKYLTAIKENKIIENVDSVYQSNNILTEEYLKSIGYDLTNNYKLTNDCNFVLEYDKYLLPQFECPDNLDSFSYLKKLCKIGLKRIFGETVNKVYIDRLKYELDVINQMGFCNYFLIVWDYVKYAKENNILVGPGRGSAAGSLVSYVLNITTVDPIKYNLLFERFLNPERITMPDIDIDFEYRYRDNMVKYVIQKYGIKNVAPIITFGTLGAKQAIRDVARTMGIELKKIDKLCSFIDSKISLLENYNKNSKLKDYILVNDELKILYKISSKIEGLKRHTSIHAAGVVLCSKELDEVIPLDKSHNDFYVTGYSMEYLESLGLLKMDFLALKNLTLIKDVIDKVNIDFDSIPINDREAINIFTTANTIGIFQFESKGMIDFIKKFKPDCVEDIISSIALYRPGPMNNIDSYIKRKRGQEKIDYIHKDLYNILKDTYGIIVYQEQIMLIVKVMASYTLGEADVLRRAMSKKKEEVILKEKDKFISRSIENGYDSITATKVYDLILKFASYGFNKAHSVSYAIISIKMAYLKAHYGLFFMRELLNMVIGNPSKTNEYIYECKTLNLNIKKPDINISSKEYIVDNNSLVLPLNSIKQVGINTVEAIIEERNKAKFIDIFDFINRCYGKNVNKQAIISLIYSGCFDCLGYNKKTLINNIDVIINYGEIGSLLENELKPIIDEEMEYSNQELMKYELEMFGFYVMNHPTVNYKSKFNTCSISEVDKLLNTDVQLVLMIKHIKEIDTKNNEKMCFITAEDEVSKIEIVVFPKVYKNLPGIKPFDIILVSGKVEKRYDKIQIICINIEVLNEKETP
ncbi:MAG: DNA polymerase III subunit alpha [Clostridium sp.]|nr:DNA polymerase III subunit alpha [Clostridium sp.]MCM1444244.1 DNA polymerase III subunit alpha [Candidatus Amulumruptor caecigallinarius]